MHLQLCTQSASFDLFVTYMGEGQGQTLTQIFINSFSLQPYLLRADPNVVNA
jgi:hypothetical protein